MQVPIKTDKKSEGRRNGYDKGGLKITECLDVIANFGFSINKTKYKHPTFTEF
jgi:hypothetical protein